MRIITVNGKEYKAKEFDYNTICDLEDMGINLEEANSKPMSMVRAYFALCANTSKERAGKEIEQHIIGGGNMEEVIVAMSEAMDNSDFFRNLNKTEETEVAESEKKEK